MRTNNPTRGLLTLTYFKTRDKIWGTVMYALIMGVVYFIIGGEWTYNLFVAVCMIYLPLQVIAGMSENEGRWERFQISLPIKRKHLLKTQYLSLVYVAVLGGIILTASIGLSTVLHEALFNDGFVSALISSLYKYGMGFLAIGLCFTLSIVVGNFAAWVIGLLVPSLLMSAMPPIAERVGVSIYTLSVSIFIGSVIIFIASYFTMKTVYEKVDF